MAEAAEALVPWPMEDPEQFSPLCSHTAPTRTAVLALRVRRVALLLVGLCALLACAVGLALVTSSGHPPVARPMQVAPVKAIEEKFAFPQLWPEGARPECRARLDRLETLHAGMPELISGMPDPDFPPDMTSIGKVDVCGDAAHGISVDCSEFNHWVPMQTVAQRYGFQEVSVLKSGGVQWHDIGQGSLGTCYFLGALASLANTTPRVIENMFVRRDRWKEGIYTTKWLVNDQETLVEVDSLIPANNDNIAFFVRPSATGEFWPAILEKAWAKIHGSFQIIEGGWWPMPVMAMTQAPVRTRYHKVGARAFFKDFLAGFHLSDFHQTEYDELWQLMFDASNSGHPMAASTSGTKGRAGQHGLARRHLYSVFRAYEQVDPVHGGRARVVDVFNPWNVEQQEKGALFTMTFDHYWKAFFSTFFAEVIPNYRPTAKKIQRGQENKWSHHNFQIKTVSKGNPFFVSLNWPAHRMVKPCEMINPTVTFQVVRTDETGKHTSAVFHGKRDGHVVNSLTAEVNAGPGSYHVLTHVVFDGQNYINDLFISIYAPEKVEITEVGSVAGGDRFTYAAWGGYCVAQYHNSELRMQSETDPTKYWTTMPGGAENLTSGLLATARLHSGGLVSLQMDSLGHINIGTDGSYMARAHPKPIRGSEDWWTCQHENMFVCWDSCCCDKGVQWSEEQQACKPV